MPKIEFSKVSIDVPNVIYNVIELEKPINKKPPFYVSESEVNDIFDFDSMKDVNIKFREARAKDLVFNIVRSDVVRYKEKTSHWTEFNKKLHKDDQKPASVVGVQPLLNSKANDHNIINTCIERAKVITNKAGNDHVWFVVNKDIYAPAQETI